MAKPKRTTRKTTVPKKKVVSQKQAATKNPAVSKATTAVKPKVSAPEAEPAVSNAPVATQKRWFKRDKRPRPATPPTRLPAAWLIAKEALTVVWSRRRLFFGLAITYTVLNIILVRGFSGPTDLAPLKEFLTGKYPGGVGHLGSALTLFGLLVSASGSNSSDVAAAYQTLLLLLTSLAVIWALRQVMAGEQVRVRDCFYQGMYPLIPVVLVVLVLLLQLVPFIVAGSIYGTIVTNDIATSVAQRALWSLLFFAGTAISLYFLTSSIMAVYIAALPDMTPLKALRSARNLVRYRRWAVLRKLLFLPWAGVLIACIVMLPVIWFLTPLAPWVFFILSMFAVVIVHAYFYTLYRKLLV